MQPGEHHDFSHPLSIHLEPNEDLNSSVTVEFSVEQVPCVGDPKVSCYKSNGCIVFEGYCPIDSPIPFSECGVRNTKTDSKLKQNIAWSQESGEKVPPYSPFMHWDVIPKLLQDIINGPGLKMSEKKKQHTERERPSLIYPRITGQEKTEYSSDEVSLAHDPFEKTQWKTVGNVVDTKKPVGKPVNIDNLEAKSSDAIPDAADFVTQRKWERRGAQQGKMLSSLLQQLVMPESGIPKEDRVSAVLAAYTKSIPLKRQPKEYHSKRDTDSTSVSISSTDTGDIEVNLSEEDASNSRGSSEVVRSLADAAVGTDDLDEYASECILCGSQLHNRQYNQRKHAKDVSTTAGESSRATVDTSMRTSTAEHSQKPKHKSKTKESTVYHVTNNQGHQLRATMNGYTQASSGGHTKHSKTKTVRHEGTPYPAATSHGHQSRATTEMSAQASHAGHTKHVKEKTMKQEVTAYPVAANQGQLPTEMMFASTHGSAAVHKKHQKEKHSRHEITAYPVQISPSRPSRDAATSTVEEEQMVGQSHIGASDTFDYEQDFATYPLSRGSSSIFQRNSTTKNEITRCTMQHVLFPKNNCPYSPSLASLPLDESDIEYIIRRAQLAKSSLPKDTSLCPTERWQLRSYHRSSSHRSSSKSGRSRSSG